MFESMLLKKNIIPNSTQSWDPAALSSGVTLSNGNLRATLNSSSHASVRGTIGKTTGKWYTEFKIIQVEDGWPGGAAPVIGICSERTDLSNPCNNGPDEVVVYSNAPSNCVVYYGAAKSVNYGTFFTSGTTVGVALDLDNNTVQFYIGTTPYAALSLATYSNVGHTFYPMCGSPYATGTNGIVDLISTGTLLNPIPSGFSRW